jgi:hypothetical protein
VNEARQMAEEIFAASRPPKYKGLTRAARIGRIIREDVLSADRPLWVTLRDVYQSNQLTFDPPYSDATWQAIARARLEAEGVEIHD